MVKKSLYVQLINLYRLNIMRLSKNTEGDKPICVHSTVFLYEKLTISWLLDKVKG